MAEIAKAAGERSGMRTKQARLGIALLATTALALGAIEIEADVAAGSVMLGLRGRGVRVASLSVEPLTGRLTLRGLQAGAGMVRLAIGRLDLPLPRAGLGLVGPASAETAGPAGATASATDVTLSSGATTIRLKRIDMAGTALSDADLASLLAPAGAEPLEARLRKLTATAIVVPEILVDDATPGSERHATISQVLLSGVTAGKIAAASAAAVKFAAKDGTSDVDGHLGPVQGTGLDLPQIAHVFGTLRTDASEKARPLADTLTATGFEIRNAKTGSTLTIATLKESGAKGRPLASDALTGDKERAAPPSDADKSAAYDDMIHSFQIDGLEATDIAARGTTPDEASSFGLASLSVQHIADGGVGGFNLRALHFDGRDVKLGIGAVEIGPVVLPRPKGATNPYATNAMLPASTKAEMRQLDVDVLAHPDSGVPNHTRFTVAQAGFASEGQPDDIPRTAKMTVDDFGFDLPATPGQAQPLVDMGYSHLDVSAALSTSYDAGTHAFDVHKLTLDGAGMGTLDLGLQLANVTRGVISSNQEIAKAAAFSILAKAISLDLVDAGLVERAIAWKAKQDGLDAAKEKAFLADFFGDKLPASLGQSANAKIVGAAIAKFVEDPKNLHIAIVSQSGLGVGSMALLADPGLLIDTLEVKASANQ